MTLDPLISTAELAALTSDPDLRIIDAGWHMTLDGPAAYRAGRIPGARLFDLDAASDPDSRLPHTLPSPARFAAVMGGMGVSERDRIVVYDAAGLFSAARVWWMLKIMGVRRVQVLDGGLPRWQAEGRPVESGPIPQFEPATFTPTFTPDAVADLADVREALKGEVQVVDARSAARFSGKAPDPRPGVRAGHMPGALNLPYADLLDAQGLMKNGTALSEAFADAGVDVNRPIITSCGSGVTAAILTLGLERLGHGSRIYDGSWSEWGSRSDTPVQTTD